MDKFYSRSFGQWTFAIRACRRNRFRVQCPIAIKRSEMHSFSLIPSVSSNASMLPRPWHSRILTHLPISCSTLVYRSVPLIKKNYDTIATRDATCFLIDEILISTKAQFVFNTKVKRRGKRNRDRSKKFWTSIQLNTQRADECHLNVLNTWGLCPISSTRRLINPSLSKRGDRR